jgi:hypothetical protein
MQAALTGHEDTKRELETMAREYKEMADYCDRNPPDEQSSAARLLKAEMAAQGRLAE